MLFMIFIKTFIKLMKDVLKAVLIAGIVKIVFDAEVTKVTFIGTSISFLLILALETFILKARRK